MAGRWDTPAQTPSGPSRVPGWEERHQAHGVGSRGDLTGRGGTSPGPSRGAVLRLPIPQPRCPLCRAASLRPGPAQGAEHRPEFALAPQLTWVRAYCALGPGLCPQLASIHKNVVPILQMRRLRHQQIGCVTQSPVSGPGSTPHFCNCPRSQRAGASVY